MAERRLGFDPTRQVRELLPLIAIWSVGGLILAVIGAQNEAPVRDLFLDPAVLADRPWYTGLVSNLGVLCWSVAATAALGGAWVAQRTRRPSAARFLAFGGAATAVLLADDLFQIHAAWLPQLGVSKPWSLGLVAFPALAWLVLFSADLLRTRWLLALAALMAFTISVIVDRGLGLSASASLLVEDGGKFLGVLAWAQYFVVTAKDIANSTIRTAMSGRDPSPVTEPVLVRR